MKYDYLTMGPGRRNGRKSDAILKLGPWNLGEQKGVYLLISVKRFITAQSWPLPPDLKPLYRLRKSLVDTVLQEYANHSSRLGYLAITE